jgi:hypothetical protein
MAVRVVYRTFYEARRGWRVTGWLADVYLVCDFPAGGLFVCFVGAVPTWMLVCLRRRVRCDMIPRLLVCFCASDGDGGSCFSFFFFFYFGWWASRRMAVRRRWGAVVWMGVNVSDEMVLVVVEGG